MIQYPEGYGTNMMTLGQLKARHSDKMHPEFSRRFFAYLEHKQGALGIGGGWRKTQPQKPGFAPDGKSFHQDQTFASGRVGYCAVDLVVPNEGGVHKAPAWADTEDAPDWGLHTFIKRPSEPWHIQPIEIRGWETWAREGRKDPDPNFVLPNQTPDPEPPPVIPPKDTLDMFIFIVTNAPSSKVKETWLLCDGTQLSHIVDGHAAEIFKATGAPQVRAASADQTRGLIMSCRTMNPCPEEWEGTGWETLWNSSRT